MAAPADAIFCGVQFPIVQQPRAQVGSLVFNQLVATGHRLYEGVDVQDGLPAASTLANGPERTLPNASELAGEVVRERQITNLTLGALSARFRRRRSSGCTAARPSLAGPGAAEYFGSARRLR